MRYESNNLGITWHQFFWMQQSIATKRHQYAINR